MQKQEKPDTGAQLHLESVINGGLGLVIRVSKIYKSINVTP